jgi:predicted nucleic acid-binding protein
VATSKKRRTGRVSEGRVDYIVYVESSGLLAALLEADREALKVMRSAERLVTSALTFAEANRALIRATLTDRMSTVEAREALQALQTFRRRCDIVDISDEVLARAGRPFPIEPIRTLDAIHLSTLELLGEPPPLVTVLTRDRRVMDNARALGYSRS